MSLGAKLIEEAARLMQLSVEISEMERLVSNKSNLSSINKDNLFALNKISDGFDDRTSLSRGGKLKKTK